MLGLVLVVVALARPQQGLENSASKRKVAIEMCIDRSGSMQAMDFQLDGQQVNRLTAVKQVFRDFVTGKANSGRPNDQIGLIAFGGYADSKCPLTLDHAPCWRCSTRSRFEPIKTPRARWSINVSMKRT